MRVKRGIKARRRRNRVLKAAEGFQGRSRSCYTLAVERLDRARAYSYRDRKVRKREFRRLWTQRINAAARLHGTSYSKLMGALNKSSIEIDRKALADMAVMDPKSFGALVEKVMA